MNDQIKVSVPLGSKLLPPIVRWIYNKATYRRPQRGQYKGRVITEVVVTAVLPDNYNSGGMEQLTAMMDTVGLDTANVLESVRSARQLQRVLPSSASDEALQVLKQIIHDLPSNKDWLDPHLEARARALTGL